MAVNVNRELFRALHTRLQHLNHATNQNHELIDGIALRQDLHLHVLMTGHASALLTKHSTIQGMSESPRGVFPLAPALKLEPIHELVTLKTMARIHENLKR